MTEENILRQQEYFESFKDEYNNERPHHALSMKLPVEVYEKSNLTMPAALEDLDYPGHDLVKRVTTCGGICMPSSRKDQVRFYLGTALAGENVGLKEIEEKLWQVDFMNYQLVYYDQKEHLFLPTE